MLVRKAHLTLGAHHAIGFDTTDLGWLQLHAVGRNDSAILGQNNLDASTRIGSTADDLQYFLASIDLTDTQTVSIWMLLCFFYIGDGEVFQDRSLINDFFHFKADDGQLFEDFLKACVSLEIVLQPG